MLKTWIEIKRRALEHNFKAIKSFLKPQTKLWAVVKSNAYGHGLILFSQLAASLGVDPVRSSPPQGPGGARLRAGATSNGVNGFCVDSVVEGLKLRQNGIKKPILVLGPTLPNNSLSDAVKHKITLTISSWEALERLIKSKWQPEFHLKIDTGMHRQGFYLDDLSKVIKQIRNPKSPPASRLRRAGEIRKKLTGVYTHFASAKDLNYPTFTDFQFHAFRKAIKKLEVAGFRNLVKHAAATGAALINPEYHLDAVRVGIGLYGLYPSRELETQLGNKIRLQPILSWQSVVSEVKNIKKGDYIGYDLVERVLKPTKMAIIPIGYWHGFDRGLSSIGEVLISGKRAKVLGRVSMDLIVVDVTGINCKVGSRATIIGKQGREEITAGEIAQKLSTNHYEILTRINPLIERVPK